MLLALGAVSSIWDSLQSLTASSSSSASSTSSTGQGQAATNPFDPGAGTQTAGATGLSSGTGAGSQISPQTMSALLDAQSQSGTTSAAPTDPSGALQDLFSQIDGNGDGSITKSEFETALGAGGTNVAAADDVFGKLDSNGDGSVSLDELKSALQGGHHGGHTHVHSGGSDDSTGADPLSQALSGASSTAVTNSDGSTTTSITYADGSKVSLTTPAVPATTSSGSSAATSSYNLIERMIEREAQALSASVASSFSVSV